MAFQKMKIAIDVSPLRSGHFLQHRVRGTGFYLTNLLKSLRQEFPENDYHEFVRGEKVKADIYHYPYFEPFFLTLPSNINQRSIVTVHDLTPLVFPNKFPSGVKGKLRFIMQKQRLRKAGAIITDSQNSKNDIARIIGIPAPKINVVYLAAGDQFKPQSENAKSELLKKIKLPKEFALYVGDATWNKNLPNLIQSFIDLKLPLAIAGQAFTNKDYDSSNPWNQSLKKAQELASKNPNIISLGFISDEDLPVLYSSAKVFVMPSLYEGFGLPILEAMQSGCPVITSDKGSLNEVAGDAAEFVDPEKVDSIKNGVLKVWSDKNLREEMVKKGLLQAKKFSWKKTARDTMRVYENVG